ncbi:MAG: recombination mediator RecR [Gemmatimonadales bacterium]|nr:recombination protein RecR [Gemmatimonadota bacterium]MCC7132426.1 recombination protein RecR [Gemmatimonadales bacterium]MDX2058709.1 recombination mediator RecR [Gemmatimonadales bacterium]
MGAIDELAAELAKLPGIGRKTAQRLTYHLLLQPKDRMHRLAAALDQVAARVQACPECGNYCEGDRCGICADARRDPAVLCVVEDASAVGLVERATGYKGRYLVLGGRLSPLEGVGPDQLRIGLLRQRVAGGEVREVILATNPSLEGEATATFIQQLLSGTGVRVSRLARGLPVGGDLEYIDGITLSHALEARQEVS